jgi:hypothetical protein
LNIYQQSDIPERYSSVIRKGDHIFCIERFDIENEEYFFLIICRPASEKDEYLLSLYTELNLKGNIKEQKLCFECPRKSGLTNYFLPAILQKHFREGWIGPLPQKTAGPIFNTAKYAAKLEADRRNQIINLKLSLLTAQP